MSAKSFDSKNLPGSVWKYKSTLFMVVAQQSGDFLLTECDGHLVAFTPRTHKSMLAYLDEWRMQYLGQFNEVFDPQSVVAEKW